jgi:diacylglycerol kinase (ATP)
MASETKQVKKAGKTLHKLQAKQAKGARKLSQLRDEIEMRSRKFQRLESKLVATAEQAHAALPEGEAPKRLRPARLIINPTSGGFARLIQSPDKIVARLRAHGLDAEVYLKTTGKAMRAYVRQAVTDGADLIIAAGGDGTLVDVAGQLVGTDVTMGILPTGTMNNVARELGIPLEIEQACALLGAGITRHIDVGHLWSSEDPKGSYFLETAGVGLAIALPAGQNVKKGRWGRLPAAFREMFARDTSPIVVELDNGCVIETTVRLVTVSNAPLYALNNLIAPDAKMDDGLFDVAVYDGLSDLELAAYFLKTAKGQRVENPNVRFFRARHVRIWSRSELPVTSDNAEEPKRQVLDLEVLPRALTAIVGKGAALAWPVEAVPAVPPLAGSQQQPKTDPVVSTNGKEHALLAEAEAAGVSAGHGEGGL